MPPLTTLFARACCRPGRGVLLRARPTALLLTNGGTLRHAIRTNSDDSRKILPITKKLNDSSAHSIGAIIVAFGSALVLTTYYYVVETNKEMHNQVSLAQKEIALIEERSKKEIAVLKERSKTLVAKAKLETAERLLKYGYAAEFHEYQKHLKRGEHHGKEEGGGT